ncbi:MAG: hypothetical protein Rubg2KO_09430 [Rubricoccaceae bacterium]
MANARLRPRVNQARLALTSDNHAFVGRILDRLEEGLLDSATVSLAERRRQLEGVLSQLESENAYTSTETDLFRTLGRAQTRQQADRAIEAFIDSNDLRLVSVGVGIREALTLDDAEADSSDDAYTQAGSTGSIDWGGVAHGAAIGALGGISGGIAGVATGALVGALTALVTQIFAKTDAEDESDGGNPRDGEGSGDGNGSEEVSTDDDGAVEAEMEGGKNPGGSGNGGNGL